MTVFCPVGAAISTESEPTRRSLRCAEIERNGTFCLVLDLSLRSIPPLCNHPVRGVRSLRSFAMSWHPAGDRRRMRGDGSTLGPVMPAIWLRDSPVFQLVEYTPIWLLLKVSSVIPADTRAKLWGNLGSQLTRVHPGFRNRVVRNLERVMPELTARDRKRLLRLVGQNAALTLSELLFNGQFGGRRSRFDVAGPGLATVDAARGKGCIIVSGHFGQWEAVRHVLRARDLTCAAIYKPNRNRFFDGVYLRNIKCGGEPIFEIGSAGMRDVVRHLRDGGFVSLLLDQRYARGEVLDFLGRPAMTSTIPAELALKFSVPIVPAYGTRLANSRISVEFETPIEHSDAASMTQAINDSLAARVRRNPEQWNWLHRRWANVPDRAWPAGAK